MICSLTITFFTLVCRFFKKLLLAFNFLRFYQEAKKKRTLSVNLFVDIPPLALHRAAVSVSCTEKNSINTPCDSSQVEKNPTFYLVHNSTY
jgi:hypothetical protein